MAKFPLFKSQQCVLITTDHTLYSDKTCTFIPQHSVVIFPSYLYLKLLLECIVFITPYTVHNRHIYYNIFSWYNIQRGNTNKLFGWEPMAIVYIIWYTRQNMNWYWVKCYLKSVRISLNKLLLIVSAIFEID